MFVYEISFFLIVFITILIISFSIKLYFFNNKHSTTLTKFYFLELILKNINFIKKSINFIKQSAPVVFFAFKRRQK